MRDLFLGALLVFLVPSMLQAAEEHPALILLGALPIRTGDDFEDGNASASITLDVPRSPSTSLVWTVGGIDGMQWSDRYFAADLRYTYATGGVRWRTTGRSLDRHHLHLGVGALRWQRDSYTSWPHGDFERRRSSGTELVLTAGLGGSLQVGRSRFALVGELSGVVPQSRAAVIQLAAGVRFSLR